MVVFLTGHSRYDLESLKIGRDRCSEHIQYIVNILFIDY